MKNEEFLNIKLKPNGKVIDAKLSQVNGNNSMLLACFTLENSLMMKSVLRKRKDKKRSKRRIKMITSFIG